ncbi:MAG: hypothetical protein ACLRFE_03770 [Clostridia bacterium]
MKKRYWLGLLICLSIFIYIPLLSACGAHTHSYTDWQEASPATCTDDQVLVRFCTECEHVEYSTGKQALGHKYSTSIQISPATCTEYEIIQFRCLRCDEVIIENGDAPLGHLFEQNDWYELTPGTCTEFNTLTHKCKRCDVHENKTGTNKGPHVYDENWEHFKDATCITYNLLKRNCLNCDHIQTKYGNILDEHHYDFVIEVSPATCTNAQVIKYKCTTCDQVITKSGEPAVGHEFRTDDWYEIIPATCTDYNVLTHKCQKCDVYENKNGTIIGNGHHVYDSWYQSSPATCTEDAKMQRDCIYCTHHEIASGAKATGHSFNSNDWVTITPANCSSYAILEHKCNNCNHTETKSGTKYGNHQYETSQLSPATCTEDEILQHICKHCNHTKTSIGTHALGHSFETFEQVIPATCTNDEVLQANCIRCNVYKTVTGTLAYGHDYSSVTILREASCTKYEILQYDCIHCHTLKIEKGTDATGHNYTNIVTVDPTTTSMGYIIYSCECGEYYTTNQTCLITYKSIDEYGETDPLFPNPENQVVLKNTLFTSLPATVDYIPIEYRVYETPLKFKIIKQNDLIDNSLTITIVWQRSDFGNMLHLVKKLEDYAKLYNSSKAQLYTMQYIRTLNSGYKSSAWNIVAGTADADFATWLNNKDATLVNELKALKSFTLISTGEQVDFRHMVAIVNTLSYSLPFPYWLAISETERRDLVSWGGDLCQLIQQLKGKNLSGDALQAEADRLLGASSDSSFGDQDLYADLDAFGIYEIYKAQSTKSISEAIKSYYENVDTPNYRKKVAMRILFKDYCNADGTPKETLNQNDFINYVCNLIFNNGLLEEWCNQNGVTISSTSDKELKASATAFVKYLINQ